MPGGDSTTIYIVCHISSFRISLSWQIDRHYTYIIEKYIIYVDEI